MFYLIDDGVATTYQQKRNIHMTNSFLNSLPVLKFRGSSPKLEKIRKHMSS